VGRADPLSAGGCGMVGSSFVGITAASELPRDLYEVDGVRVDYTRVQVGFAPLYALPHARTIAPIRAGLTNLPARLPRNNCRARERVIYSRVSGP
jgi:hypothetical protein